MSETPSPKPLRGFAALSKERRAYLSSLGGKAVPSSRRSFSSLPGLASSAGKVGGKNSRRGKVVAAPSKDSDNDR